MLLLGRTELQDMLDHAAAEWPREACGVLGGRDAGSRRVVEALHPCRNVAAAPEREYLAEPHDQLRAFLAIEEAGLEVVGVYHSHPHGPAGPSALDQARAAFPGLSYVVLWGRPGQDGAGWGSWRWVPPRFEAEKVVLAAP
jgi:desampylase